MARHKLVRSDAPGAASGLSYNAPLGDWVERYWANERRKERERTEHVDHVLASRESFSAIQSCTCCPACIRGEHLECAVSSVINERYELCDCVLCQS